MTAGVAGAVFVLGIALAFAVAFAPGVLLLRKRYINHVVVKANLLGPASASDTRLIRIAYVPRPVGCALFQALSISSDCAPLSLWFGHLSSGTLRGSCLCVCMYARCGSYP
jgi:hypothetical protein